MATLLKTDGTESLVTPANGTVFSLQELQAFVGGYIEMVPSGESGRVLVVNEEGLLCDLPLNARASAVLRRDVLGGCIVGDAVLCTRVEAGFNDD